MIMRMLLGLVLPAALFAGCGEAPPPAQTSSEEGRPETATIRATESIGVAGDAIGDKVDAALDVNDARKEELDKAMQGQ